MDMYCIELIQFPILHEYQICCTPFVSDCSVMLDSSKQSPGPSNWFAFLFKSWAQVLREDCKTWQSAVEPTPLPYITSWVRQHRPQLRRRTMWMCVYSAVTASPISCQAKVGPYGTLWNTSFNRQSLKCTRAVSHPGSGEPSQPTGF
jgi:hypothetical protein